MSKRSLWQIGILSVLLISSFLLSKNLYTDKSEVDLRKFDIIVSDNSILREKGLGQRDSLQENSIMLFVFDHPDYYAFWMKDMRFSIDIVWLDEAYNVVYIEQNISADTYPKTFSPVKKAKYVVEGNIGFVEKNNIEVGKKLIFPKLPI